MSEPSLVVRVVRDIAKAVMPSLTDMNALPGLGQVMKDKGSGHTSHRIDYVAERALFESLGRYGFKGTVFSEESGLVRQGREPRILVCDPYCNTMLTFRGVRESAVTVYEYLLNGTFVAGAIADLQLPRILSVKGDDPARILPLEGVDAGRSTSCSAVETLGDAFLVVSMLKKNRRENIPERLLRATGQLATIDGGIVALRMCAGEVDGFVDPVGQPTYEALAYELVRRAGGVVTDRAGAPLRASDLVERLTYDEVGRHPVVAGATLRLHAQLMAHLGVGGVT